MSILVSLCACLCSPVTILCFHYTPPPSILYPRDDAVEAVNIDYVLLTVYVVRAPLFALLAFFRFIFFDVFGLCFLVFSSLHFIYCCVSPPSVILLLFYLQLLFMLFV